MSRPRLGRDIIRRCFPEADAGGARVPFANRP